LVNGSLQHQSSRSRDSRRRSKFVYVDAYSQHAARVRQQQGAGGSTNVLHILTNQKIDILICDSRLPPHGGLPLTRAIRRKQDNANRTIPILVMTSDGRETTVKLARDAGANMVITKPMSPGSLYDRLAWIAFNPRQFVDTPTYFGPDRRFKIEGYPNGIGRRKGDKAVEIGEEAGPALAQGDIDSLFSAVQTGQDS
jgi:two-component system, chemotaxis family, chemotaxis protein CheY